MGKTDRFKVRKPTPQDPVQNLEEHGVHGDREENPTPTLPTSSRRLLTIPLAAIRPGRYQKRESIDTEKYQQLKDQIQELGLNFVALLFRDPDDPNFYNPAMGGHLRIQAARELGITEVAAVIRDYDNAALAKGTYMENQARQSLTPLEEGHIFAQCQQDLGWTQEQIATYLLVPGGRSHVALCLLLAEAAPDLQEMIRRDPKKGQRAFFYFRQLDELGVEKAMRLRAPHIEDFLLGKIATDEARVLMKHILERELGESDVEPSVPLARRAHKITSTFSSFSKFEKEIGDAVPSQEERATLLKMKAKIESLLERE